jgi:hypothetical protein
MSTWSRNNFSSVTRLPLERCVWNTKHGIPSTRSAIIASLVEIGQLQKALYSWGGKSFSSLSRLVMQQGVSNSTGGTPSICSATNACLVEFGQQQRALYSGCQKIIRLYEISHWSGVTQTLHIALPLNAPQLQLVWSKSGCNRGYFSDDDETVFCLFRLVLQRGDSKPRGGTPCTRFTISASSVEVGQ